MTAPTETAARPVTDRDLELFIDNVIELREENYERGGFASQMDFAADVTLKKGRKYAKLIAGANTRTRSVYCFVDLANGDVLKAASWKAPAKHARGNIFTPEKLGITVYGAEYL